MRNLFIAGLSVLVAAGAGFVIGECKGWMNGREEVIQLLVPSQPEKDSAAAANIIEVETKIRKFSESREATILGLTMRTNSGKPAYYRGGPLVLVVRPVENHDKTITIAAKWSENSNAANPDTIVVPPVTIVNGGTATQQIGPLRFSFTAKVEPK